MGILHTRIWSVWPCPPPGDLPNPGIKPRSPALRAILYCLRDQGNRRILEWVAIPSPGDLPDPGIERGSPAWQADASPAELPGKHAHTYGTALILVY